MCTMLPHIGKFNFQEVLEKASKLPSIEEIRGFLQPHYKNLVNLYENDLVLMEEDYRSGNDTYGYEDLESIQINLSYISDRWQVCFRVRWVIELINPGYILYGE